jgi:hypothetical protein
MENSDVVVFLFIKDLLSLMTSMKRNVETTRVTKVEHAGEVTSGENHKRSRDWKLELLTIPRSTK